MAHPYDRHRRPRPLLFPLKSRYHLRRRINRHRLLTHSRSLSVPALAVLPLVALFAAPIESRAEILPKEQIISSLTQVESAIDQIREVGSTVFSGAGQVFGAVSGAVKPGVDVALPILKQAGEQAVKIASPVVSDASKKAPALTLLEVPTVPEPEPNRRFRFQDGRNRTESKKSRFHFRFLEQAVPIWFRFRFESEKNRLYLFNFFCSIMIHAWLFIDPI